MPTNACAGSYVLYSKRQRDASTQVSFEKCYKNELLAPESIELKSLLNRFFMGMQAQPAGKGFFRDVACGDG